MADDDGSSNGGGIREDEVHVQIIGWQEEEDERETINHMGMAWQGKSWVGGEEPALSVSAAAAGGVDMRGDEESLTLYPQSLWCQLLPPSRPPFFPSRPIHFAPALSPWTKSLARVREGRRRPSAFYSHAPQAPPLAGSRCTPGTAARTPPTIGPRRCRPRAPSTPPTRRPSPRNFGSDSVKLLLVKVTNNLLPRFHWALLFPLQLDPSVNISHDCTIVPFAEKECKGAQHLQKEAVIVCVSLAEPTFAGIRRARVLFSTLACTGGSSVGIETPDEKLSRIALGRFCGHENTATTSGGGTYSPPQDEFPFF
ncbi:unnamed protein product [Miscanthus lutarioriparius]|uniref:Uncharacterized protein n=1 Tax=Miscanthus lutarioriparius TaxID=422564 RepID=A0A811P442_9POAL|nr:unnamed protein product [Miscanthus lutarioriparius]